MISIKYSSTLMCSLRELSNKDTSDEFYHQFGASVYEAILEVKREFHMMKNLSDSSYGLCPRMTLDDGQTYALTKFIDFMRGK